jgi:aerobic carbon-monoxide dehydrogenase medium subunit
MAIKLRFNKEPLMENFVYHHPGSVADALAKATGEARFLAGGQSLLPSMKLGLAAPDALIDLNGLGELRSIKLEGDELVLGSMATHASVAASDVVKKAIPGLADLAGRIGDRQVRNLGTIGGSLANNDPAACYPAALLGLGGTVVTDKRSIDGDSFFKGFYETALQPGEMITSVRFKVPQKAAYEKFRQPASRFSIVGVFVSKGPLGVRVAVTGAGPVVFRVKDIEDALMKDWSPQAAAGVKVSDEGLNTDLHGSAKYRAALIPVLAGRAVKKS